MLKILKKIKDDIISPPKAGEIVEAVLTNRGKNTLYFDLGLKGIGIVFGKEFLQAKGILKPLKIGDIVLAKVVAIETDEGYRELSLAQANQEMSWEELSQIKERGDVLDVSVKSANKGGLICPIDSILGFLPASQLSQENYPKVEGADPSKIAQELQKLVGKKLKVKILDVNPQEKKLILSERSIKKDKAQEELLKYQVGNIVEAEISGVTSFGVFLKFGDNLEGLVHASEIPIKLEREGSSQGLQVGQKVKAKITEISESRVYLSMKNM